HTEIAAEIETALRQNAGLIAIELLENSGVENTEGEETI
ncbi:MAG: DNA recombination/repair protein RecA, partial [Bartonella sp.]|nr:DNA recombination/repair protein RecA [Bartonella sp.]